jgi:class 3 adenylate cyclase
VQPFDERRVKTEAPASPPLAELLARAKQLEERERGQLSLAEMEKACAEIGLDPRYVRKAMAQLQREARHPDRQPAERRKVSLPAASGVLRTKQELLAWAGGFWLPVFYAIVALLIVPHGGAGNGPLGFIISLIVPFLLSWVPGFLTGRKRAGALFGLWFATCMLFAMVAIYGSSARGGELLGRPEIEEWIEYAVVGVPMGVLGAWVRAWVLPPPWHRIVNRQDLLDQLFALQKRLEGDRQRRAFLSVDVVGSWAMKRDAAELAVEHSFGALRSWIDGIVRECGGEMQIAAGDGVMCLFPDDALAVRSACRLQSEIDAFNAERNRLPTLFRIRCGISAGEVAIAPGTPIGFLDSAVIDRAAALQKSASPDGIVIDEGVSGTARAELRTLERLTALEDGVTHWRSGSKVAPHPEEGG